MRVSKRQLKRIIREEKNKLIAENRLRRNLRRVIREAAGDLGESASVAELEATAKDPSTPLNVLQQLASNKGQQYRFVRQAVAEHPNVSPELLEELSSDSEKGPVFAVAENPKTPVETLKKLASHENAGVRREVARNVGATADILMQLVTDPDRKDRAEGFYSVRRRVAANPRTPPGGLQKLATDQNKYVRIEVAKNPSTSPETLEQLMGDAVATVRNTAKKNLKFR